MGEYDVTIKNKSNGTETTVTVTTANSSKAAENVSVAATAVNALESNVAPNRKRLSRASNNKLSRSNIYGISDTELLNAEKTKLRTKINSLQSTQNQEELDTYRTRVSNAKTMNQLTQLSTQLNLINTPPEPVSIKPPTKQNQKKTNKLAQMARKTTASMTAKGLVNKSPVQESPVNGGKRRSTKRKSKARTRKQRK